jgi:hypothetical protein
MTTNQTTKEISVKLEEAKIKDINIKIEPTISTCVHFLDVTITNENGRLRTCIYHKPTTEPYILPYTSDHPRHFHRNIPYAALLRAARICSNVNDSDSERIRIDVSLLLNHYPPHFISKQFNRFFHINDAMSVLTQLNQQVYYRLYQTSLYQPTRREKKFNMMMQNPVEASLILQQKIWNAEVMYPRYLFDSGLTIPLPKSFHTWWKTYFEFPGSPLEHVKVQLVTKTNYTIERLFIHKKPAPQILTKMEPIYITTTTTSYYMNRTKVLKQNIDTTNT